jgi:hypothetical protein
MLMEHFEAYSPQDFVLRIAESDEDLRGFWSLRRQIFCEEQGIFVKSDRDAFDDGMIPIVCKTLVAGMEDLVIGVVRIDERAPGIWYGSRLGVDQDFRRVRRMSPGVSVRNRQPVNKGFGAIGAALIYKAVSTAHALGCKEFYATVQEQNARFFERLHWQPLETLQLHGRPHVRMQADLDHYRPAEHVF